MTCLRRAPRTLVAAGLLCGLPAPALAGGFYLQEQAPKEIGRALAGQASAADDPSTVYHNPAGITALPGVQLSVGGSLLTPTTRQRDRGTTRTVPGSAAPVAAGGNDGGNPFATLIPVPSFYLSAQIDDRLWAGFGLSAPFGLKLDYDAGFFGRYDSTLTDLKTYNLQPTLAYRLTDSLSVGGGLDAQYVKVRLESALPNASPATADGLLSVRGDDWSFGWNVGVQWRRGRTHVGLAYRSAVDHVLTGSYAVTGLVAPLAAGNVATTVSAPLGLPDIWTAGVTTGVGTPTRLMLNANYYNWSRFRNITLRPAGGGVAVKALDYRDSYSISAGVERDVSDSLTLRAGTMWDKSPTNPALLTTRVPDGNRTWASAGATLLLSKRLTLNLAYAHTFIKTAYPDRADTVYAGTAAAITTRLLATTRGNADQLAASLVARF